ncbi:MAG: hypothetical protein QOJ10_1975 [Chloroflexota bacterium]|jgi:hypothetical protein|nr:hypothetical protein [Chloroflexota bacterium]
MEVARLSAETSAPFDLGEVCRWLIQSRSNLIRLRIDHLPALGQRSRLRLALPITAPRAVLCAAWVLEDIEAGGCLLVGQLRFVAHPAGSGTRLSFNGRTATAMSPDLVFRQANQAARELVEVIARSIAGRPWPDAVAV